MIAFLNYFLLLISIHTSTCNMIPADLVGTWEFDHTIVAYYLDGKYTEKEVESPLIRVKLNANRSFILFYHLEKKQITYSKEGTWKFDREEKRLVLHHKSQTETEYLVEINTYNQLVLIYDVNVNPKSQFDINNRKAGFPNNARMIFNKLK